MIRKTYIHENVKFNYSISFSVNSKLFLTSDFRTTVNEINKIERLFERNSYSVSRDDVSHSKTAQKSQHFATGLIENECRIFYLNRVDLH